MTPTRETAMQMASDTGLLYAFVYRSHIGDGIWANGHEWTEELHALVAAAYARGVADEREACAKLVEGGPDDHNRADHAEAIRNRGAS